MPFRLYGNENFPRQAVRRVHPGSRHTQGGKLTKIESDAEAGGRAGTALAKPKSKPSEFLRLFSD